MDYKIKIERFAEYEYDEVLERETDTLTGYAVFSTVEVSPHLVVRTTTTNRTGRARSASHRGWWIEFRATFDNKSSAHARLTEDTFTFWQVIHRAEEWSTQIEALTFTNADEALAAITPFQRAGYSGKVAA